MSETATSAHPSLRPREVRIELDHVLPWPESRHQRAISGTIGEIGTGISPWLSGQRIIGEPISEPIGMQTVLDVDESCMLPRGVDPRTALSFTDTVLESWHALVIHANVRKTDSVFIDDPNDALGAAMLETAMIIGAHVLAQSTTGAGTDEICPDVIVASSPESAESLAATLSAPRTRMIVLHSADADWSRILSIAAESEVVVLPVSRHPKAAVAHRHRVLARAQMIHAMTQQRLHSRTVRRMAVCEGT